jgi:diaminopimelate epimerase
LVSGDRRPRAVFDRAIGVDKDKVHVQELPFWKYEAIGNDFVMVHAADAEPWVNALAPHEDSMGDGWGALARLLCVRRYSVGGDGLLVVEPAQAAVSLRMFNPDGSEDFCGNGVRCAALHAFGQGWTGRQVEVRHGGARLTAQVMDGRMVRAEVGRASFDPATVPLSPGTPEMFRTPIEARGGRYVASAVSTGSTHLVLEVDELPADDEFFGVSSTLESDARFPQRTSVIWCHELEPALLAIRIYERGAGETWGCGTGSAAAAAVWSRASGLGGVVTVRNPGGTAKVLLESWDAPIFVEASARVVFRGMVPAPALLDAVLTHAR